MPHSRRLVTLENVALTLGNNPVLQDISLTLEQGQITTLIGPNGAGKSTLARVVLGLIPPQRGQITRRPGLCTGYMPQKMHIDDSLPLTVDRFLWLAARKPAMSYQQALQRVDVGHLQHQAVQSLSGGELQRVLLARALLRQPQLLVLDEPAQGVDVSGQNALYGLLKSVRDELQCAILLISHDLHLVMASTDQVVCLQRHICCSGTPESVSRDPAYHALFGPQAGTPNLALYTHQHNHSHDLHGEPCPTDSPGTRHDH